ncbi:FAD-dependent oxidoreductase [Halomarina ordinaria]|uniref:FAD-dependent oxidoreductase n=1 Tax=Halomarina ordinaria TaxID=3033939 RepID=A0ABD5U7X9_9EURY|nr:FAD-dependent oxidoreductase [Halomarina sp. PSRA2]
MDQTDVTVAAVREVGTNALAIDFETPTGFDAQPGQFVRLSALVGEEEVSRFYTVSSPEVGETFEVTLTVDPEGEFGTYLASLAPGDAVSLAGPFGDAHYEGEERTFVLAGGPGVGPAVAIAERTLDDGGDATVVYRDDDPIHGERLAALAERGVPVAILEGEESLDASLEEADDDGQVFVYGFAPFIDDARDALDRAGYDVEAAKLESFGPEPGAE